MVSDRILVIFALSGERTVRLRTGTPPPARVLRSERLPGVSESPILWAVAHQITWEPRGVVKRFHGVLTGEEFAASVEEITADPRFDELLFTINDFTGVEAFAIDAANLDRIAAARYGSMVTNRRIRALVVATDPRMVELVNGLRGGLLANSNLSDCFSSVTEARAWLQAQPPLSSIGQ